MRFFPPNWYIFIAGLLISDLYTGSSSDVQRNMLYPLLVNEKTERTDVLKLMFGVSADG